MSQTQLAALDKERHTRRAKLQAALQHTEDPLALYESFVNWTIEKYPPEYIPRSGLLELLEEAGRQLIQDNSYKGDRRYLKIWLTYAQYVDTDQEDPTAEVYKYLLRNDIGTSYAQLYEDYAGSLERFDRRQDADKVYQYGIQKRARPLDRLKQHHTDFRARQSNPKSRPTSTSCPVPVPPSAWKDAPADVQLLRRYPFKNYPHLGRKPASDKVSTAGTSAVKTEAVASSIQKYGHDRYMHMLTPASGTLRRPEKLKFNLSLLFTEDGTEYCAQEARAKSMGLLGKKWPPPPPPVNSTAGPSSTREQGSGGRAGTSSNKKVYAEPTMTIATKEALADVFGMYNSPEKTLRFGAPVGSKYAPVRKVESMGSLGALKPVKSSKSENASSSAAADENNIVRAKTPVGFKPFVDEGITEGTVPNKSLSRSTVEFQVFQDEPNPFSTENAPNTSRDRRALTTKESSISILETAVPTKDKELSRVSAHPEKKEPNIFLPVFTPVAPNENRPSALARTDSPTGRASPAGPLKFTPFADSDSQPSKPTLPLPNIFSRPSKTESPLQPLQPKAQPLAQRPVFTPFVDSGQPAPESRPVLGERSRSHTPLQALSTPSTSTDDDGDQDFDDTPQVQDQDYYDDLESTDSSTFDDPPPQMETHTPVHSDMGEEDDFDDDDEMDDYPAPMGGRLGKFNIMTPITERTFEYTHTTAASMSARATPSDGTRAFTHDHIVAKESADQLAAELANDDGFSDRGEDLEQVEEKTGTLSLSDALAAVSSFKPPNPCNPFDGPIMASLFSFIPPDPAFYDLRSQEAGQLDGLQKFSKKKNRRGSANASRDSTQDSVPVNLNGRQYDVLDKLGEGGFGAVFEAIDVAAADAKRADLDDEDDYDLLDEDEIPKVALKVVRPRNLWEFHVLRRLHLTLSSRLKRSVIIPEALYAYRDESFLVLQLLKQGTLLDVVNNAPTAGITQQGACLDELLVMFFAIELLRLLEGMHAAGFIHGDMKIDNCLLRLEEVTGGASSWTSVYQASGEGGWGLKGIKMIDFGRTIDTRMFPFGQRFIGDWDPDARDCLEMREGKPWTYQTDYFGLAGIIYCMLYGKYIETSSITAITNVDGPTRYKLSTPFKRYWQGDLWARLFDILLNSALVHADGKLPLCDEIGVMREEMEVWLQANCNRASNSLKGLLKKVELMTLGGKDGR